MDVIKTALLSSAALLAALPAFAEEIASPSRAETVVVSATRAPLPVARIGVALTIITAETIRESQSVAALDLLRDVPGVTFSRNGGVGSTTSVRIRGAEGDQTVLVIDGIKLSDPSTPGCGPSFANLLIGNVDRIEVLKGPQSTLYGSQAIGGVVNVITRSGAGPRRINLQAEAGSRDSYLVHTEIAEGTDRWSYALSARYYETGGFSAFDARRGGKEDDGYSNIGINGRLTYKITDAIEADLRAWYVDARVDFDGFPAPAFSLADTPEYGDTKEVIGYAGLNITQMGGRLKHRIGVNATQSDRENFNPRATPTATFIARGQNQRWEYQGTLDVTPQFQLIGGAETERSEYRTASPSSFTPNPVPQTAKADISSVYLQAQASPISGLTASAGLRHDDQSRYGSATTARVSVAFTPNDGATTFRANYGDGFKAPTLFQLFSDFGNSRLVPEQATSWDFGVEQSLFDGRVVGSFVYFQRETKNQIDFASCFRNTNPICATRPFGFYDNIARTAAKGVEASLETKITDRLSLAGGYAQLSARNRVNGNANFNKKLARRADTTASLTATYSWPIGLTTSATVSAIGDSFENASNSVRLKGYTLVGLRAAYKLNDHYEIYARAENVGDEAYSTAAGYGSPPREVSFGVRATF